MCTSTHQAAAPLLLTPPPHLTARHNTTPTLTPPCPLPPPPPRGPHSFLPCATQIIGYARTPMSVDEFHGRLGPFIKGEQGKVERFLKLCTYMHGDVSDRLCWCGWVGG